MKQLTKQIIKSINKNPSKWKFYYKYILSPLEGRYSYFLNEEYNIALIRQCYIFGPDDYFISIIENNQIKSLEVKGFINRWKITSLFIKEEIRIEEKEKEESLKKRLDLKNKIINILNNI